MRFQQAPIEIFPESRSRRAGEGSSCEPLTLGPSLHLQEESLGLRHDRCNRDPSLRFRISEESQLLFLQRLGDGVADGGLSSLGPSLELGHNDSVLAEHVIAWIAVHMKG